MNNIEEIITATISLYEGNLYLKTDCNPVIIDIEYEGKILAESALPNGFFITEKNNRIMVVRLSTNEMPEHIFSYVGDFKIIRARVYSSSHSSVYATIDKISHKYRYVSDNWSQLNNNWASYFNYDSYQGNDNESREKYDKTRGMKKSKIIINNLIAKDIGMLHLPTREIYKDEVNYDSNFGFFTGSVKTKDSIHLKRKKKRIFKNRRRISAKNIGRK